MAETGQPVRILHLDDDPIDAELVNLTLEMAKEHLSASVTYVQTEEQFVDALEHGSFDVILSDYRMPRFNGDEALKIAQEKCPEIPFIMVTGELGEERAIETLHRGATDYVLKDRMFRLIPAIKRALTEADNQKKRREAEREREGLLQEDQKRRGELLAIIQAMHGGVIVFDTEGCAVLVNDAAAEILGYSRVADLKQNLAYFTENYEFEYDNGTKVPVDDWPISHVMRGESIANTELKGRRKDDGREWFFSFSGQPVMDEAGRQVLSVLVTRDITNQKRAEEVLRLSEERLRLALDAADLGTFDLDLKTNIAVHSLRHDQVWGYPEGVPEWTFEIAVHHVLPEDVPIVFEAHKRANETGVLSFEARVVWPDGSIHWIAQRGITHYDDKGNPIRIIGVVADITERKRAERQIRTLTDELEERVKERTIALERANQDLESFGYTVAHDLKAPLRAIDSFGTLLSNSGEQKPLSKKQQEYLSLIHSSADLMRTLIESLLAFSRTARLVPKRVKVNMRALAEDVLQEERQNLDEAAERVQVTLHDLPSAPVGDPVLLRQVFANLIDNAYKFTRKSEKPKIEIGGTRRNGELIYYVRDNGVGFRREDAAKLFQAFNRLHSKTEFEGTGIGLASVRKIIERHGGEVFAEGEEGRGATFYFSLPSPEE